MFELKLNNKTIPLKWGTWAMREFCVANNIGIDKYFELLGKTQFDLDLVVKMIYTGYKSACVSSKQPIEYDENDVCDWIDELGGLFNTEGQFIEYVKYIISVTVTTVQGVAKEEKKKPNKTKLG
ncbi:hypothetical protein UFOVP213_12 [uncultured Caudovirales phage]|uniref:Uncharacterized protein n=1 Tax=uncultured Caudovirales phage TaxID=2100421 RepID=A0A6J7WK60_9CAUD|nr:hypothetical protein UFOVP213_12 [uncultured Caudovirales phage]